MIRKFAILILIIFSVNLSAKEKADLITEGNFAYKALQFELAYKLFDEAQSLDESLNSDPEFSIKHALSALKSGKSAEAEQLFSRLDKVTSHYSEFIKYYHAEAAYQLQDFDKAYSLLRSVQKSKNTKLAREATYMEALYRFENEQFVSARTLLDPLKGRRDVDAGKNHVRFLWAVCAMETGAVEAGRNELFSLVKSYPSNNSSPDALEILDKEHLDQKREYNEQELIYFACVYTRHEEPNKAAELLDKYFSKTRSESQYLGRAYFERGRLRYARKQYKRAILDFEKSFELLKNPRLIRDSRLYIARSMSRAGDKAGAEKEYHRYAREYPSDKMAAEALWIIGLNYERRSQLLKASEAYEIVTHKAGNNRYKNRAFFRTGYVLYKNNHLTKASEYFEQMEKKFPGTNIGLQSAFWRAKAYEKLGRNDEAKAIFEKLANLPYRNYYVIAAREKTEISKPFSSGSGVLNGTIPSRLKDAIAIGELFGEPWGSQAIDSYKKSSSSGKEVLVNLYNAYKNIGTYRESIVAADRIYNRYFYGNTSRELYEALYPLYYKSIIDDIRDSRRINNFLIYGVVRRESLFGYNAVSSVGATGLMQLMRPTAKSLAKTLKIKNFKYGDVYKPEVNLRLGVKNLADLMQRFKNFTPAALAAYNAGDTIVRKWMKRYGTKDRDEFIENIEYTETNTFVKEVLKNYYYYNQLYAETANDSNDRDKK